MARTAKTARITRMNLLQKAFFTVAIAGGGRQRRVRREFIENFIRAIRLIRAIRDKKQFPTQFNENYTH